MLWWRARKWSSFWCSIVNFILAYLERRNFTSLNLPVWPTYALKRPMKPRLWYQGGFLWPFLPHFRLLKCSCGYHICLLCGRFKFTSCLSVQIFLTFCLSEVANRRINILIVRQNLAKEWVSYPIISQRGELGKKVTLWLPFTAANNKQ